MVIYVLLQSVLTCILGLCLRIIRYLTLSYRLNEITKLVISFICSVFKAQTFLTSQSHKLIYAGCLCLFIFPAIDEAQTVYFFTEGPCEKENSDLLDDYFNNGSTIDDLDWTRVNKIAAETDSIEYCVLKIKYSAELDKVFWVYDVEYNKQLKDEMAHLADQPLTRANWKSRN